MSIPVSCPTCGKKLSAPDEMAGKAGKCTCGELLRIPGAAKVPSPVFIPATPAVSSNRGWVIGMTTIAAIAVGCCVWMFLLQKKTEPVAVVTPVKQLVEPTKPPPMQPLPAEPTKLPVQPLSAEPVKVAHDFDKYNSAPTTLKTTLTSLKKLQAKIEVGITQSKYSDAIGDSWGDVKVFIESADGEKYKEFSALCKQSIDWHETALACWKLYNERFSEHASHPEMRKILQRILTDFWHKSEICIGCAELFITGHAEDGVKFYKQLPDNAPANELNKMKKELTGD